MSDSQVDIAIAGAGLAGRTLAILLARTGLRCVLIDTTPLMISAPTRVDPRALAITDVQVEARSITSPAAIERVTFNGQIPTGRDCFPRDGEQPFRNLPETEWTADICFFGFRRSMILPIGYVIATLVNNVI